MSAKEFKAPVTKRKQKEEEDFPRGGASGLTPLEYKEIAHQADSSLFSEPGQKPTAASGSEPAKKKRKPTKKAASDVVNFENTFDAKKLNVEILSFKRLNEGTKVLGCISAISRSRDSELPELVVSLPNNLTGYVNISEISDELIQDAGDSLPDLNDYFFVGQWVQCVIIGMQYGASGGAAASGKDKHRRKIFLSLKPFIVNAGVGSIDIATGSLITGAVQSVEDHGYIVNLGMSGMHGFLKNSEAKMYQRIKNNDKPLAVGQVLAFSVVSVENNKKTVQLTVDAMKVSRALLGDKFSYSEIASVMPGCVIEAHITEIQDIGVLCKFMGHFDATIDYFHTAHGLVTSKKDLEESFKVNEKIRARVLYVDLASQPTRIGLSTAKHVMGLTQPNTTETQIGSKVFPGKAIPIGRSIDTVTVKRIDARHGLLCEIDGTDIPGYVHISRVADERLANLTATGKYRVDSTHRAMVVGYDPVDGLFQLSLQSSVLDQPFLRVEDIEVGSVVKGTVIKSSDRGVVVSLAKNIRGFVPLIHCVDSVISNSTKKHVDEKFKEGKVVKCRVLSADTVEGKVVLTCKDSLINSKLPVITSLEGVTPGTFADGVIVKTNAHGCIVAFYNNVKAFAHISELQEAHVTNLNIFQPGQVKTCRVLEVDADEQKMKVSFKKSSEVDLSAVTVGSLQKGKIVTIKKDIIHITLKPSETKAILPVGHLSDHLGEQAERIHKSLKEGMVLTELVVLSRDETRGSAVVSKKPLLVLAAKQNKLITDRAQLKEGQIYPGSVRQVTNFGVFVEFCNGVDALAFRHNLSDMSDSSYIRNQSVLVKVTKNDVAESKTEVTLKPSEVGSSADSIMYQGEFLASYFKQLERLAKKTDSTLSVGACTMVEVQDIGIEHWTVSYGSNKSGLVALDQAKGVKGKKGTKCAAKILDVDFEREAVEFTLKDSLITADEVKEAKAGKFFATNISKDLVELAALQKSQESVEAVVELVKDDYLVLSIPQHKNLIAFAATRSFNNRRERFISHKVGEKVKAVVAFAPKSQGKGQTAERVILSLEQNNGQVRNGTTKEGKKAAASGIEKFEDVQEGVLITGRVATIQHMGLDIHLGGKVFGRIHVSNIADTYAASEDLLKNFKKGQMVKCLVLNVDKSNKKVDLSLRPSRLSPENHTPVHDPEVKSIADVVPGGILQGFVSNVADKGLFIALNQKLSGRVKIAELSDDYLKDWKSHFTVGQLVKAKVVNVNEAHNQIELTLKASQIDPSIKAVRTLADFTKGEKVKGTIKAVKDIGVFIKIDNSAVSGLCHISEISENHVPDVTKLYAVGDPVKAMILDIDLEKKRISFGLKSSYFEEGDAEEDEDEEEEAAAEDSDVEMEGASDVEIDMGEADSDISEDEDEEEDEEVDNIFAGHDSDSEEDEEDEEEEAEHKAAEEDSDVEMTEAAPLAIASGFNWDGKDDAEEDTKSDNSDSEDDSDDERSSKKKKAKKQAAIVTDDTEDLESQAPQVSSDYERLLLGSPNSSYLWINYMAFQLQLSEISKAREIGQRALKSISFREEQEKMNVWVALMNLENTFGSADTLEEVFKNAVQTCEPKKVYLQLVKIYERSNKIELATELYNTMTKKFGQSSKVWTGFGHFQLHHGNLEAGRELLQRSLKSLPKRKHIKTISKFAQLEFKYGEPERGRTIFEGVMSNYPKRIDLWSVYIDMEVRNGEQDAVRRLFARVVSLKMSSKKMKFFFKKWLAYEKDNGDEENVEEVKRRALAYVESLSA